MALSHNDLVHAVLQAIDELAFLLYAGRDGLQVECFHLMI